MVQLIVDSTVFDFQAIPTGLEIKNELNKVSNVEISSLILSIDGIRLNDHDVVKECDSVVVRTGVCSSLVGGKGGFGAMLRSQAKQKAKTKTTDFGACRDLSGRRLRHINDEIILSKWKEAKDRGEAFDVE